MTTRLYPKLAWRTWRAPAVDNNPADGRSGVRKAEEGIGDHAADAGGGAGGEGRDGSEKGESGCLLNGRRR